MPCARLGPARTAMDYNDLGTTAAKQLDPDHVKIMIDQNRIFISSNIGRTFRTDTNKPVLKFLQKEGEEALPSVADVGKFVEGIDDFNLNRISGTCKGQRMLHKQWVRNQAKIGKTLLSKGKRKKAHKKKVAEGAAATKIIKNLRFKRKTKVTKISDEEPEVAAADAEADEAANDESEDIDSDATLPRGPGEMSATDFELGVPSTPPAAPGATSVHPASPATSVLDLIFADLPAGPGASSVSDLAPGALPPAGPGVSSVSDLAPGALPAAADDEVSFVQEKHFFKGSEVLQMKPGQVCGYCSGPVLPDDLFEVNHGGWCIHKECPITKNEVAPSNPLGATRLRAEIKKEKENKRSLAKAAATKKAEAMAAKKELKAERNDTKKSKAEKKSKVVVKSKKDKAKVKKKIKVKGKRATQERPREEGGGEGEEGEPEEKDNASGSHEQKQQTLTYLASAKNISDPKFTVRYEPRKRGDDWDNPRHQIMARYKHNGKTFAKSFAFLLPDGSDNLTFLKSVEAKLVEGRKWAVDSVAMSLLE